MQATEKAMVVASDREAVVVDPAVVDPVETVEVDPEAVLEDKLEEDPEDEEVMVSQI